MYLCLLLLHAKITEPIWLKFRKDIDFTLDKWQQKTKIIVLQTKIRDSALLNLTTRQYIKHFVARDINS